MKSLAEVSLWGKVIAAVALDEEGVADFEYDSAFALSGIQVAPVCMPLSSKIYRFPELSRKTFYGLPGLLADALPDKFGHALIDTWLASQGREAKSFNAIERLCYTGDRAMGALEFKPVTGPKKTPAEQVKIDRLVALASSILNQRQTLNHSFDADEEQALTDILRVGTSAGGARAKAVIAWNPHSNEVRSGQIQAGDGFEYWLLKFDGVNGNRDKELNDHTGFGVIEYAYYRMAKDCAIDMSECRLFEENGRRHFMTRRFDRTQTGEKLHLQSLCALAHYDFNQAGAYSYEQAFLIMRQLGLTMQELEQQFRRMVFNIVARNQDDHVKNIAFLMDKSGQWSLSPAYDVTYSYNPSGDWTAQHQMTLNGKRDGFVVDDFKTCARNISLKRGRAEAIVKEVVAVVSQWCDFADEARVSPEYRDKIARVLRVKDF